MDNNREQSPQQAERSDDDFLKGAAAIAEYLCGNGLIVTNGDVYYLAKAKKLPIGKWGKNLIASKRQLSRNLRRAAQVLPS
jgi:hypothetical protein